MYDLRSRATTRFYLSSLCIAGHRPPTVSSSRVEPVGFTFTIAEFEYCGESLKRSGCISVVSALVVRFFSKLPGWGRKKIRERFH
jgi:hypothetical protein